MARAPQAAGPGSGSIAFDRAAEDYDRTRALSAGAMRKVQTLLARELRGHQPCLEIGVGTGRMALPLARSGIRMTGIDLSAPMLRKLIEKAKGRSPFPVAVADAVALPFPQASFGAGLACHVLHLIPSWADALAELVRVVRPSGVVLVDVGGRGSGWWREVQAVFCREAGIAFSFVGADDPAEVERAMRALGARPRTLPPVVGARTRSIAERLEELERGVFSFTWSLDQRTRTRAARRAGEWAEERIGSLTTPRRTRGTIRWLAFDLP